MEGGDKQKVVDEGDAEEVAEVNYQYKPAL